MSIPIPAKKEEISSNVQNTEIVVKILKIGELVGLIAGSPETGLQPSSALVLLPLFRSGESVAVLAGADEIAAAIRVADVGIAGRVPIALDGSGQREERYFVLFF